MKSRARWQVLWIGPLLALGTTVVAQPNEGVKQVDRLITASGKTVKAVADTRLQLVKTMEAYDALMARDAKDRKKLYDRLQKEMQRLDEQRAKIGDEAGKMKSEAGTLFEQWAASIAAIENADLRARSEERMEATKASYGEIEAQGQRAAELYTPFMKDLQDQITYLGHDLNAAAVASLAPEAEKIGERADRLVESIDDTIATANRNIRALRPE